MRVTIFLFTEGQNTLMGKQQLGWWTRQAAKIWFSCQQWGEKETFAVCEQVVRCDTDTECFCCEMIVFECGVEGLVEICVGGA